jgi:hypothetical protein
MDYKRLAIAAVVTWVVDAIFGMVVWQGIVGPRMAQNPAVFRSAETMTANLPLLLVGGLVAIFVMAYIYAKGYEGGSGIGEGLRYGLLLALLMTGFVSIPIYATFNIGGDVAMLASIVSFVEMIMIGVVLGLMYKPAMRAAVTAAARV